MYSPALTPRSDGAGEEPDTGNLSRPPRNDGAGEVPGTPNQPPQSLSLRPQQELSTYRESTPRLSPVSVPQKGLVPRLDLKPGAHDSLRSSDYHPRSSWATTRQGLERIRSRNQFDRILMEVYTEMVNEEPDICREAIEAEAEDSQLQQELDSVRDEVMGGKVNRRAPLNPLPPRFRPGYNKKLLEGKMKRKVADPAARATPIYGKLLMCIGTSIVLLFNFFQALIANKVSTGSFYASRSENSMLGPSGQTLLELGALNANYIRNQGEAFRIFWCSWMHTGWIHILLNLAGQIQYFWMMEPDWGFRRCLFVFGLSMISGSLMSLLANPCSTTVGSSGGLFGLMGAICVYYWEYWKSVPRPMMLVIFSVFVAIISFIVGFTTGVDNWSHLGGLLGGIAAALLTVPELPRNTCSCRPKKKSAEKDALPTAKKDGEEDSIPAGHEFTKMDEEIIQKRSARLVQRRVQKRSKLKRFFTCGSARRPWVWGKPEIMVRAGGLLFFILYFSIGFSSFYHHYHYNPPGQPSFTSGGNCHCCAVEPHLEPSFSKTGEIWMCYPQDRQYTYSGLTFRQYCDRRNQQP